MRRPTRATAITIALAVAAVVAARLLERIALRDVPHVMDEIAYVFQARTFLLGRVALPPQLPRPAFAMWLVDDRAARYAVFPPGWPAVLALAMRMGLERWLDPLIHGATVLGVARAARRLGGERAQVIGAAAYAFSPQALLLAASLMSQTLVALAAVVVIDAGIASCVDRATPRRLIAAGAGLAIVVTTRPACAVVLALTFAVLLAIALWRGRLRFAPLVAGAIPLVLGVLALFAYNRAITGKGTRFPQNVYFEEHGPPVDAPGFRYRPGCNDLGLGETHGCDATPHTLSSAADNTAENLEAWFLLAGGGPLVFLAAIAGIVAARDRAVVGAMLAAVPIAIVLYALYWNAGTCFGARFYHAALPSLVVAGALGADACLSRWRAIGLAAIAAWTLWSGYALAQSSREIAGDYFGTDDRFARLARGWDRGPAVVMIAFTGDGYPRRPTYRWTLDLKDVYFSNSIRALSALWLDDPLLEGPLVFAKYHPALVPELRARYAGRRFFVYVVRDGAPGGDELLDLDDPRLARDAGAPYPRDNFDGYILSPAP